MADALSGIEEDVPFDFGAADDLIASARAAASDLRGQRGSRHVFVRVAMAEFRGYFSELFEHNAGTAQGDADELAERLDQVAGGAQSLATEARNEQRRREVARQWKRDQEGRNLLEKGVDAVGDFFGGEDQPPFGPPAAQVTVPVSAPPTRVRQTPSPGTGGGGGGTSSARPDDLRSFASGSAAADQRASTALARAGADYSRFVATCHWGSMSAEGVVEGGRRWLAANEQDVLWARTVADAFEAAGGSGAVSTLADSAIAAALQSAGVSAVRQDLAIDPPTAYGSPPTSGYADDPVNTSTGNFLEPEADLGFPGACSALVFTRMYNSLDESVGALGRGWSSWTEAGLLLDDDAARFVLPDGRQVTFPRLGGGWDRATGENLWLDRHDGGFRVTGNDGTSWVLSRAGRLLERSTGPGTTVRLEWDGGEQGARLVRMSHERGRHLDLQWGATGSGAERLLGLVASDGREVAYGYDEQDRLVSATSALGTRRYRWDDHGRVEAVVAATGVDEVENAYDERGRVARQRSAQGRITRYAYLPGRVTVVSDEDGTRSNTWVADDRGRLVGVVDADERRQSMSYDPHGNVVAVTERDGATTVREYDDRGRLVRTVSPNGADVRQSWDELDRLVSVEVVPEGDEGRAVTSLVYAGDERNPCTLTDPEGGVTQMAWSGGLLTEVVDPTGVTVRFTHDEHGDLVATTDAEGGRARLERDDAGRVVAAVTPSGHRTHFTYDEGTGLLVGRTDPGGGTWAFEHTPDGRLAATTDPAGGRTETSAGPDGQVATTIDPLGRAVSRTFDDLGNVAALELPDGSSWRFAHDALSRLRETTDPTGAVWTRDYDATGGVTTTTSPTGESRQTSAEPIDGTAELTFGPVTAGVRFDRLGRLVASERPDGSTVLTRHDRCGRAVELIDAAGGLTQVRRDPAGRPLVVVHPGGGSVHYEYDRCGRLAAVVDELDARTEMTYDADSRLVAQTMPTGERATWTYDAQGRVTKRRVPGLGTTLVTYDALGRVVESRDPQFGRRRFRYDAAGQLVEAVDGNGGTTRWEYDANGRAVAITDPLGAVTRREYDAMNRVVAETDPLGRTTRGGYDSAGRQVWQEDPTGSRTTWTYDTTGRVASVSVDGSVVSSTTRDLRARTMRVVDHAQPGRESIHELAWDPRGLLVSRTRDGRGLTWEYDADGRRTARIDPDGSRTTYARDAAGRLVGVENDRLGRASFERDAAGRLVRAEAGGLTQSWRFGDGFLAGHEIGDGQHSSTTLVDRDDLGRIATLARDGVATSYSYDEAHQLVAARTQGPEGESVARWRYDAAGRLVAEDHDGAVRELIYDVSGRLVATAEADGRSVAYTYDGAGRRTRVEASDGARRDLTWNRLGWLSGVTDRHADGREKHVTTIVDALGQLARLDDAEVFFDSADPRAAAPARVGDTPVVATGPFLGLGDDWQSPGWRGSRATGEDPWDIEASTPDATGATDATGVGIGGAGELTIAGLEWMGARVYDPSTRGFVSVDPWEPVPGAPWSGNPYSFAGNDPMNAVDPSGLSPMTDADLEAYMAAHQGALHAAGDWMKDNWEYVAGGAMVIAGGVLIATGVGGPAGMMLVAAGADTIIQKATTGQVSWGQVAISGAFGAWGGTAAAARMGVTSAFGRAVVGGMVSGGTSGAVGGAYSYASGPGPHSAGGLLGATTSGGLFGGATGGVLGGAGHGLGALRTTGENLPVAAADDLLPEGVAGRTLDEIAPTPAHPAPPPSPTPAAPPGSGIYVVSSADGVYVGQSGDIDRRLLEHVRAGKFTPDEVGNAARQGVAGGRTDREIAEQLMIDRLGGRDELLNRVNPIGDARLHLMPDQPYSRP